MATMMGWHFLPGNKRLRGGTKEVVKVGKTLAVEGPLVLCRHGFHASKKAIDALNYAPSTRKIFVTRVVLSGTILMGIDKAVAAKRKAFAMVDATKTLHEFACWCAEEALKREERAGRKVDERSWRAIEIKRLWLKGRATTRQLAAAKATAGDSAMGGAAVDSAWAAAWASPGDSAWVSAGAAAWGATGRDNRDARAAVWDAQSKKLEKMLRDLLKEKSR